MDQLMSDKNLRKIIMIVFNDQERHGTEEVPD